MKVVGLTGTIGAGKEVVKDFFTKKFNCYVVLLSDVIRGEMERKSPEFNRKTLQDLGNELREKYGPHILAKIAVEYLPREKELTIIDGVRNPAEIQFLKEKFGEDFKLIAIDAPPEIRFKRLLKRGRKTDPKSWEEFVEMDKRDLGEDEPSHGQQVKECFEQADFNLVNNGTIEELKNKIEEIARALF
jgi:dephospho-CoA kinase